jgi:hypothetical protein
MAEVLFRLYFTEGKNLGDRDVLLGAAEEVGVEDAAKLLESTALAKEVVDDINISIKSHPMMSGGECNLLKPTLFLVGSVAPLIIGFLVGSHSFFGWVRCAVPHYVIMAVDEKTNEVITGTEVPGAQVWPYALALSLSRAFHAPRILFRARHAVSLIRSLSNTLLLTLSALSPGRHDILQRLAQTAAEGRGYAGRQEQALRTVVHVDNAECRLQSNSDIRNSAADRDRI